VLELDARRRESVLLDRRSGYTTTRGAPHALRFAPTRDDAARDAVRDARPCSSPVRRQPRRRLQRLPARRTPADALENCARGGAAASSIEGRASRRARSRSRTPREAFDAEEQAFVLAFARQCAQAIHRAALYEAERGARAEAEAAQERAEGARREAAEANQAKSAFLATMSHELRTPINAIIGYAELLEIGIAGPLTEQQRVYLERLTGSSAHLLGLVNDVLDLAKIEAGETRVAQRDASTGPAVLAALDLVRPQASGKGVRLVDGRPADAGAAYVGDEDRVRQIALNLLSNAVKFTMPGGTVTVTCDTVGETPREAAHLQGAGPWAYVRVADTGIGIAPEEQARIFDPFHQVDTGHTRTKGGTGLGLAISRRLARLMGGDLTVQSAPGAGATFTLWLPAARRTGDAQVETAADRTARAQRDAALLEALGLGRVGAILRQAAPDVLAAYAERLRTDPATPAAHGMRHPQLEDHQASLLADLAQSLVIVDDAGAAAAALLKDGSAIQRTIADQHGARRFAQGWREAALRRDYQILREEIERAVRDRLREGGEAERAADVDVAVRVLLGLVDRAEAVSVQTWRRVADEAGHPATPGVPDGPPSRAADAGSAAALPARDDG
jgi:signal transduction histidine kinase